MIQFPTAAFGLDVHPSEDLFVAGFVDGSVRLQRYRESSSVPCHAWQLHKQSSRAVVFARNGQYVVSTSAARALRVVDIATQQLVMTVKRAHKSPVYSLASVSEFLLASGDDDGTVKLWDIRTEPKPVFTESVGQDFISDFVVDRDRNTLLVTGGDGKLSVFNFKQRKLKTQSDQNDCDLLCATIFKGGKKVACGTGEGALHIYSWGEWGDISDRVPVDTDTSIDACVTVDNTVLCLGGIDGSVQLVQLFPHQHLGQVGHHDNEPVECLRVSPDRKFVLSCSHDETVRVWNVEEFLAKARLSTTEDGSKDDDLDDDDSNSDNERAVRQKHKKTRGEKGLKRVKKQTPDDFFADL